MLHRGFHYASEPDIIFNGPLILGRTCSIGQVAPTVVACAALMLHERCLSIALCDRMATISAINPMMERTDWATVLTTDMAWRRLCLSASESLGARPKWDHIATARSTSLNIVASIQILKVKSWTAMCHRNFPTALTIQGWRVVVHLFRLLSPIASTSAFIMSQKLANTCSIWSLLPGGDSSTVWTPATAPVWYFWSHYGWQYQRGHFLLKNNVKRYDAFHEGHSCLFPRSKGRFSQCCLAQTIFGTIIKCVCVQNVMGASWICFHAESRCSGCTKVFDE